MYEKNSIVIFIIVICFGLLFALAGCRSRPVVVATDESLIASQASVVKLREVNEGIGSILSIYDEFIGGQIANAIGGIGDALIALDRYDEFVQELIRRIRELELSINEGTGTGQGKE